MADLLVPGYNDTNRAFLQAILAQNTLTWQTARPLIAAIESVHHHQYADAGQQTVAAEDVTQDDLDTYINKANRALLPLDLEIRSTLHQLSRERIYALVNTTSDPIMQLATTYSADEIAFVKKMLDAIFDGAANRGRSELMCLSGIQVVQLAKSSSAGRRNNNAESAGGGGGESQAAAQSRISGHDAEELARKLEGEGWFEKSEAGFYTLSARALMELRTWLVDTYNEPVDEGGDEPVRPQKIKFCQACKEIITVVRSEARLLLPRTNKVQGQRCPRRECPCRLHDICTQNFFRSQRSRTCPICKTDWDGKSYVGERVLTMPDGPGRVGRVRASAGQSGRPVGTADNNDDDEE